MWAQSLKKSIWVTGRIFIVLSENKRTLVSYKCESRTDLMIQDVIYQCRTRGDAQKLIQDVGTSSCLLYFMRSFVPKRVKWTGTSLNSSVEKGEQYYCSNTVQVKRRYATSVPGTADLENLKINQPAEVPFSFRLIWSAGHLTIWKAHYVFFFLLAKRASIHT